MWNSQLILPISSLAAGHVPQQRHSRLLTHFARLPGNWMRERREVASDPANCRTFLVLGNSQETQKNQILWLRLVLDIDWAGDWTYHRKLACDPPSHVDSPKMFERVSQPSWTQTRLVEERHSRQHLTQHVCARELFLIDLKRRHPAWRIVCERVFSMAVRWWT